ncbi:hypothetical protein MACH09_46910 [Vibrio sp. MACH09]|uniref:type-F conjugative transfer system mating-pair stabilization protein TraN n=1 Tax=Vibrio sp. MACH09 TaxID=3025122 RepID=UPI002791CA30|nr:type-F conjugative transfer system mating-pair stabilization protein TraN [Vibrio sp. MACH09]GLO64183.1 hypothetical protein MACH09_46910 [Vibrio sp. MACH09]
MMKKVIFFLFTLLAFNALASQEQSFNQNADWAKNTSQNMLTPSSIPLQINDYCKDATCKAKVANPDEKSLNDGNMESKAAQAFASNQTAQNISANVNKPRPNFRDDPKMRFALLAQENAFEISHGVSNKYVNCETGEQCVYEDKTKTCHSPTLNPVPCFKKPILTPEIVPPIIKRQCFYGEDVWNEVINRGPLVVWKRNLYGIWGDAIPSYLSRGKYVMSEGNYHRYEVCTQQSACPDEYTLAGDHCVKNQVSWVTECKLLPECKPISEVCVEPKETRTINGIPTTLDCWKYEVIHKCDLPDNCEQYAECQESKRECSLKQNGVCIEEEITKKCSTKSCQTVNLNCGKQSFCLDGDCYSETPKLNDEFDEAAAALAALGEAAKGLGDPPKIFTGKPLKCNKQALGFSNCCKDGGWGGDIGLASCNEEEKALGRAKEKGLTIYVGEYCAEKVLGSCIRKKRSYCSYASKLGKIIQEQGAIAQLGKSLGSAKSPTCDPLTPEELSQIRFDRIDFTEFYPDIQSNINLPDPNVIQQRIQAAVGGN